jgi:rhamnosyltransferase
MHRVSFVMVTYRPNVEVLSKALNSIKDQVQKIIIVDNTENGFDFDQLQLFDKYDVEIIKLYDNNGIAKAQNIGIKLAIEEGAEYVMLSDQDSEYPLNYVEDMVEAFLYCSSNNSTVAAIGPSYKDLNRCNNREPFIISERFLNKKLYAECGYIIVTRLIATGMIIPIEIFKLVGTFEEDLFIDWVDFEWCWRARSMGYKIIGNANVVITHTVGDKKAGKFGFKEYSIHSPTRSYYTIRNRLHLAMRSPYINIDMKMRLFLGTFKLLIGYPALVSPASEYMKYGILGFYHGFIGRLGKLCIK